MTNSNFRNGKRPRRRVQHPKVVGFGVPAAPQKPQGKPKPIPIAYPSFGQQARNLAGTMGQIARNPKVATDELYEYRMKICRACAFFDHEQVRCRKCGCKLRGKARFEGAKCPVQKW